MVEVVKIDLHFHRVVFLAQLKSRVGLTLSKDAVLRITLNLDGAPITSTTHTHPSHSQTSRLLTSSLSLGVPVPRISRDYYELIMSTTVVVMSSVQYYALNSSHDNQRCTHQT